MVVVEPAAQGRGFRLKAVWIESGSVALREVEDAHAAKSDHALLRLIRGGICNTDLELKRGYYGFAGVPGHEFVAEVMECASDPRWIGRRVVGEINLACGECDWCKRGLGRHCPARTVLGIVKHPGAFAERFTLPVGNLREVPEGVETDAAVFTEPVAAACEILDQVAIAQGTEVAVLGDGKLGLLIAQVLAVSAGAKVSLYGRHAKKMAIAEAVGGVRRGEDGPERRFPIVVDATGSEAGLRQAIAMTLPRGTLVMKSTVARRVEFDAAAVIVNEITMMGSRCGRFEPAIELIASGRLNLGPMVEARYPLNEANVAFAKAEERGVLKVLIEG